MKNYVTEKLRNVCLMSHGGAGKSTLAEAMLFNSGSIDRFGKISDGTTTSDFDPEEVKRQVSTSTSILPFEWKDIKINLIDTPGYFDFVGEVKQGIRISDAAIIVVSGKSGVSVGTEKSFAYAKEYSLPQIIFINKMDEENANFPKVRDQIENTFGKEVIPFQLPIVENEKYVGYVDVINMKAYKFDKGKETEIPVSDSFTPQIEAIKNKLNEAIAETDELLMEKFFAGEQFSEEEINKGLKLGILDSSIVPMFCGSSANNLGINALMDALVDYFPSPAENPTVKANKANSDELVDIKITDDQPVAFVFKTIADPYVGKISIFRIYSGVLKPDSTLYNSSSDKSEKMSQIFILRGKKHVPVDKLIAGDIGGVAKLQHTNTNDTLCDPSRHVSLKTIEFPEPVLYLAVEPKTKGDEEKINLGLHKLQDEDPTFKVSFNSETHQTVISGVGEQHLDVIVNKLKSKFGVSVNLVSPKVAYREAIKKKVKAEGKHKKQSGGHGQFGHVWIEFEPGEKEGLTFEEKIFGGAVPKQYHPAVEKGLIESIRKGVLAGYPLVNLKATLVDGSYHAVDSSEMAFKIAAHIAFKKGLEQASPVLLEPILYVEVYVPDNYMGDAIGDLNKRRGRILGMNPQDGGFQQIEAEVPESEMHKYATDLRSITHGWGYFKQNFARYEEAPPMVSQKVIEASKHLLTEEEEFE